MRRQVELRVDTTAIEKLEVEDVLTAERRDARLVYWRNVVVGITVAAAMITFAIYCAMLDSAPWNR